MMPASQIVLSGKILTARDWRGKKPKKKKKVDSEEMTICRTNDNNGDGSAKITRTDSVNKVQFLAEAIFY